MEELKPMIARRGVFKRQLTNFVTFVRGAESDDNKVKQLNFRLEQMRNIFNEFQNTQTSIELIEGTEAQLQERDMFENKYYEILSKTEELLSPRSESVQSNAIQPLSSQIKLPQIQLPSFSGNYDDFMSFHDIFKSLIHDNSAINSIQKFHYLAAALKGDAAKVISALEMSASNYEIAWQLIKERYENKKLIIQNHIKQIFDLQAIGKESHRDLRELLDNFLKHFRALRNIGQPVDQWGSVIIHLLTGKLDYNSKKEWEIISKGNHEPTTDEFLRFLQDRCQILESINSHNPKTTSASSRTSQSQSSSSKSFNHVTMQTRKCLRCKDDHYIYSCSKFLELSQPQRLQEIKRLKGCINCLRTGHIKAECKSNFRCRSCNLRHNSLLHLDNNHAEINSHPQTNQVSNTNNSEIAVTASHNESLQDIQNSITAHASVNQSLVLLSTAIISIFDSQGRAHRARALIDSGSMSNFMTKSLFQNLNLMGTKIDMHIAGISSKLTNINLKTNAIIQSRFSNYQTDLSFLIIEKLTDNLPQFTFDKSNLCLPKHIQLADENFNKSEPVDLLLGAGMFLDLLGTGQIKMGKNKPTLQETKLGWILSGHININSNSNQCFLATNIDIQTQLEKFWEIEECPNTRIMSDEDLFCEQHFVNNYKREAVTGKFIVKLPFRDNLNKLGETRDIAISRFISNETKLRKNKVVYEQYKNFMNEYVQLGHMTGVSNNRKTEVACYLPHHSVIKNSSLTTKCRVVFDASCKSSSGLSLNDLLHVGPKVQDDLFAIILRSRRHNVIILADITKMYRQILVDRSQRSLQRIVWRDNEAEGLRVYDLNTVTYGMAPASFLATRCLKQLGLDHRESLPKASKSITNDFYVDNLITGAFDINGAKRLAKDVQTILDSASFELRQWMSNEPEVLTHLSKNTKIEQFIITDTNNGNALGITWNSQRDHFLYNVDISVPFKQVTKRHILSVIAKIFDPLGLIGPVIITAKIMLQSLWKFKLGWDETVPVEIENKFRSFISHLSHLNEVLVPRKILLPNYNTVEIHGFCDASTLAYGACIYIRSKNTQGKIISRLVCGKSRVAPIKPITIPRLELCSAVLLCKLVVQTVTALDMNINQIYYWSDSTIALSWIRTEPSKLKTFVSHRVSQIQQLTKGTWNHVKSTENPGDLISRGASPKDLSRSQLWWEGPLWLVQERYETSNDSVERETSLEFRQEIKPVISITTVPTSWDIFSKFSSLSKLTHVIAYVSRFINNCKNKTIKVISPLTPLELDAATIKLIKIAQRECYSNEIKTLKSQKQIQVGSSLNSLNPFIDQSGIIRVGGRLEKSRLAFSQKHQIILPPKHTLTTLIIKNEHHRNLHAGAQSILGSIREKYWLINGRQVVRSVLRKCVTCFKAKPLPLSQQMGELPNYRVQPARTFSAVGVDYAGPFDLKDGKTRNRKLVKAYICVFVCLCTKAVHLELVGDLTSLGFLNALKRFVSRRGLCKVIVSDNATNFTGANNIIKGIMGESQFRNYVIDNRIEWKFIPARSPHFGGLWEASVKSVKYYLKRLLNQTSLTYEEFYTFITQVEAILNSRPITALSSDPNDLEALTPGHFIIGAPLNSLPQEQIEATARVNTLTKFHHLQQLAQHFWARWSRDYLNTLQQRSKWKVLKKNEGLATGSLVIIKEDNQPPCQWSLGRITALHRGSDGLVRALSEERLKQVEESKI